MTNPDQPDDDWAELARELERDTPPAHRVAEPAGIGDERPTLDVPADHPEEPTEGDGFDEPEAGDAGEASETAGEEGGESEPGDEQPGTGRKRRRRRRRRRKGGGQPVEGAAEGTAPEPAEETEGAEAEPEPEAADELGEVEYADAEADAAEDAGGELLRELIANWNVPSWDEIVGGLYRPDR